MHSLIKYSGNFAAAAAESSRHHATAAAAAAADSRGPFGGLGSLVSEGQKERDRLSAPPTATAALRAHPPPPPPPLKREQERPDSSRSFSREGEGEVRHPPVGIAVAVARQRDSGSSGKQGAGPPDPQRSLLQASIKDEEQRGEERARHQNDRLLASRLEQEKVLRESKELAELTQMHPPPLSGGLTPRMMTPSLMTPNLMVTGGAALAGAGRWPPEPSTLTSHPWMPRHGAPPVWLPGSPYSLGPSSLHQTLPPGYPPALPGSIPPPYQFARDPQSGHLIVIPTEHLPHYGSDVMERGGPVWPGVYGAGSSLQHAAQLQLLSQQQMLRQQELLMIQQRTAQVLELQRNAQLVERLKASEHRPEAEDKADKRSADPKPSPSSVSPASSVQALHPHKAPPPPRLPTPSDPSLSPPPALPSPVTALKSEGGRGPRGRQTPPPHPASPRSASPPPSSPRRPKQEEDEGEEREERREQRRGRKPATLPFQGIYSDLPPGYPYQSITAPFASPFPPYHHIPAPPARVNMDLLPPHRSPPLAPPPPLLHRDHPEADVKPQKVEPSEPSVLKREPDADPAPRPLAALRLSCNPELPGRDEPPLLPHRVSSPPPPPPLQHQQAERREEVRRDKEELEEQEEDGQVIKVEASSYPVPLLLSEAKPELARDPEGYPACTSAGPPSPPESTPIYPPQERACNLKTRPDSPTDLPLEVAAETPERPPRPSSSSSSSSSPPPLAISSEDPMAGLLALAAASEMVAARAATPPAPTLFPQVEDPPAGSDFSATGALEKVALEGMALLSQMAQQELENMRQEREVKLVGLDCLLAAGKQVLLEAIEQQSHIDLPRTLDPNKKYSWRQRKEEPLYCKMSVDRLDAMEVEYRIQLAELQKTYKERQRHLSRLQRRRDKRERQQQQEDERRSLTRRGRGRPRKRKHLTSTPPKLDSRPAKVGRSVQYSEDSEAGEKRFRLSREDEETDAGIRDVKLKKKKKKKKSWSDKEASSSHSLDAALKAKPRSHVCEQEQLASDLDRALSLSQLSSLAASRKLDPASKSERSKGRSADGLAKERGGVHPPAKAGKHKSAGSPPSSSEAARKVKGQKKSLFCSVRSELSSCSNNSDSEGHGGSARGGWPPLPGTRTPCAPGGGRKRRSATSPTSLLPGRKSQKKKHKHLSLLLEEAGLSSSDDSFDQGY